MLKGLKLELPELLVGQNMSQIVRISQLLHVAYFLSVQELSPVKNLEKESRIWEINLPEQVVNMR